MAYGRDKFIDVAPGGYGTYSWPVNHSDEEAFGKTHNVDHTATTDGIGVVRQQGADDPMSLQLTGTIFHEAQHLAFVAWFALSSLRTIYFEDFTGAQYEVQITSYEPVRKRTLRNPRDPSIPLHYYSYTLTMDVIRAVTGPWAGIA